MCFGGNSTPDAPEPPPKAPEAPKMAEAPTAKKTSDADAQRRRRATASKSRGGTILTGSSGVTENAPTTSKTLLGQ